MDKMTRPTFYRVLCVVSVFWTLSYHETTSQVTGFTSPGSDNLYFFRQYLGIPRDCKEVHDRCSSDNSTSVHYIKPDGYPEPFEVYCENHVDSRGWTVISSRNTHGIISFDRNWRDYKRGFGFVSNEFWIGNERLSYLTNQNDYQLLIEMTISNGSTITVSHDNFRIGDEFSKYQLISLNNATDGNPWTWCPDNKVYDDCTCGQRLCRDPATCQNTCTEGRSEGCICPEGFYMSGENCIPQHQCGCYIAEQHSIIPEGDVLVNTDCTSIAVCTDGLLTRNGTRRCSPNAVCEEISGTRRCYCNEEYSGDGVTCMNNTDCMDVYNGGSRTSGIYIIRPNDWPGPAFDVFCNMTDGGGWTVFQRRAEGSVGFYRDWNSYKRGFGNLNHELWLGNDKLHYLSKQKRYRLRIDLVGRYGNPYYAKYDHFRINNEAHNYRLTHLGSYSGTAGDSFSYHYTGQFSTRDRDYDGNAEYDCAEEYHSAWWFRGSGYNCGNSDLNAVYDAEDSNHAIYWVHLPGDSDFYLEFTEMKLKPV